MKIIGKLKNKLEFLHVLQIIFVFVLFLIKREVSTLPNPESTYILSSILAL